MKKSRHLIKLAEKLSNKYAGLDAEKIRSQVDSAIWTAVRNASTVQVTGVMPFIKMSQQDGASISFDVTRNDGWSAPTITVSNLVVEPSNLLSKYQALPQQAQAYLEKYPELYPTQRSGLDVDYNNYTTHLDYPNSGTTPGVDVATK